MMEVENCIKDPQNLGHFYSNQYKKQEDMHYFDLKNFSSYNSQKLYAPVPKWPYKTLTERLILNDIFLMLKGLSNDTFELQGQKFILKEKIQVTHLTPLALHNLLNNFMKQAETIMKIQNKLDKTNWSIVGTIYEGFHYSMHRQFLTILYEINNLHVLFLLQSGHLSKDKCRLSGRCVKILENTEITLLSLERALDKISPYASIFLEILEKAVPYNFDSPEKEHSKMLSDFSDEDNSNSESSKSQNNKSLMEDNLITNEEKSLYLINYLYSFININCSNIMDREIIEVIIEIFLDTLIPYLEIIDSWFIEIQRTNKNSDWSYDTTTIKLPKFLKPYMKEILHIRKSLMVIKIISDELMMNSDKKKRSEFEIQSSWSFLHEVTNRIKNNVILHKSPLNIDSYYLENLKPENLYFDKRYNICDSIQEASQIQKKMWKLSSMETITDKKLMKELKIAPFSFNHIRESGLENTFGIPFLSTIEIMHNEGNVLQHQETYEPETFNQMSFSGSKHQEILETLIKNYKGLKNYSEEELQIYNEAMRYYQDSKTFQMYLSDYEDEEITSEHFYYFKTATLDSFIRECIVSPLLIKYEQISKKFNQTLIRDFKLDKAFEFMRKVYFMESGKDLSLFCNQLFEKLDAYNKCDDENEINGILQECLRDMTTDDNSDMINSLEVFFPENLVIPKYVITEVSALDHLSISFQTEWPLNIIFDSKIMEDYNQCFRFLLKIQRVVYILSKKDLWKHTYEDLNSGIKRSDDEDDDETEIKNLIETNSKLYNSQQHQFFLFQRELLHFAKNLETFIKTRVLVHCATEFEKNLINVENMDMLIRFHREFINKVMDLCMLKQSTQQLRDTMLNVLNNAIQLRECYKEFSQLDLVSEKLPEKLVLIQKEFSRLIESHKICMRFITGFMEKNTQNKLINHLDDAYCRLNFNYFYSNSRNLI